MCQFRKRPRLVLRRLTTCSVQASPPAGPRSKEASPSGACRGGGGCELRTVRERGPKEFLRMVRPQVKSSHTQSRAAPNCAISSDQTHRHASGKVQARWQASRSNSDLPRRLANPHGVHHSPRPLSCACIATHHHSPCSTHMQTAESTHLTRPPRTPAALATQPLTIPHAKLIGAHVSVACLTATHASAFPALRVRTRSVVACTCVRSLSMQDAFNSGVFAAMHELFASLPTQARLMATDATLVCCHAGTTSATRRRTTTTTTEHGAQR